MPQLLPLLCSPFKCAPSVVGMESSSSSTSRILLTCEQRVIRASRNSNNAHQYSHLAPHCSRCLSPASINTSDASRTLLQQVYRLTHPPPHPTASYARECVCRYQSLPAALSAGWIFYYQGNLWSSRNKGNNCISPAPHHTSLPSRTGRTTRPVFILLTDFIGVDFLSFALRLQEGH